ncbi:MAG: tol-pal system protein YbgF [Alcanivorax sp.]
MTRITLKSKYFATTALICGFAGLGLLSGITPVNAQQSLAASVEIRFQQMEKEIRRLTGQMEEQQYEIRRLRDELQSAQNEIEQLKSAPKIVSDASGVMASDGQLSASDAQASPYVQGGSQQQQSNNGSFQYNAPNPNGATTLGTLQKSTNTGAVTAASGGAAQAYDHAYSYIKSRDFDKAEQEFSSFISKYPNSDLVSNAKYWYGETFYVRGNYDRAARIFAEGYQKYPKSPKAASNLLKLGMSLIGMGKTDDACIALKQLKKDYSNSSIPVLKRADSEMNKISCS